jgi:hypothetical protein
LPPLSLSKRNTRPPKPQLMKDLAGLGFSGIFLTENKWPKPYEAVPNLWPVMADAACLVDAYNSR